jgi:hypothetical protein
MPSDWNPFDDEGIDEHDELSHPAVQFLLDAIRTCREAGKSDALILHYMMQGMEKALARMRGDYGPHP